MKFLCWEEGDSFAGWTSGKIQTFFTQEMTEISAKANEVLASPVKFNIVNANGTPEKFGQADFKLDKRKKDCTAGIHKARGRT